MINRIELGHADYHFIWLVRHFSQELSFGRSDGCQKPVLEAGLTGLRTYSPCRSFLTILSIIGTTRLSSHAILLLLEVKNKLLFSVVFSRYSKYHHQNKENR